MNKIALILLLGLSLVVTETIAQDEYDDEEVEMVYEEELADYDDEYEIEGSTAIRGSGGSVSTDITRWNYTEEEIAKKEAKAQKQAQREEEYEKSIEDRRRSGLFFGLGIGYSGGGGNFKNLFKLQAHGIGAGVFVGYQQAFNQYAGFRAYGEVDYNAVNGTVYGKIGGDTEKEHRLKALANIDFYFEGNMGYNIETLGAFIGVGGGFIGQNFFSKGSNYAFALAVNFGIHSVISTHHRIEVFMRVTPSLTSKTSDMADVWLRYSYMF